MRFPSCFVQVKNDFLKLLFNRYVFKINLFGGDVFINFCQPCKFPDAVTFYFFA